MPRTTATRVPTGLAAWRARNLVRVRDFDAAPSVDLDLVPYAIDACAALGLDEAQLVVPTRDALPVRIVLQPDQRRHAGRDHPFQFEGV